MFTEQDIKPIPKYIEKKIKNKFKHSYIKYPRRTYFFSYLTKIKGELAQIFVATKRKGKEIFLKQVAVHGVHHKEECYVKDIAFIILAGYVVGWYEEGLSKTRKYFEDGEWSPIDDKYFNIYCPIVNKEFLDKFKEYQYSLANKFDSHELFKYLRIYEQYPQAEFLVKMNLKYYATKKQILRLIGKDKKFRKWLIQNQQEIDKNYYYVSTLLEAYKKQQGLKETQCLQHFTKELVREKLYQTIKRVFKGDIKEFYYYLTKQDAGIYSYRDYLRACEYLELDMNEAKNRIPHNFRRWHDIRIDQYHSAVAKAKEEKQKEFYKTFGDVAKKYAVLQRNMNENFVVLIAKSPKDLVNEGEKLHHCVGRMNYDQKFAREETLIFFVRNKENQEKPFVTMEYSLQNHRILQCYARNDTRPEQSVLDFVNKIWLPYANRKIRKIA